MVIKGLVLLSLAQHHKTHQAVNTWGPYSGAGAEPTRERELCAPSGQDNQPGDRKEMQRCVVIISDLGPKCGSRRPAASASPGGSLEMQSLRPQPGLDQKL